MISLLTLLLQIGDKLISLANGQTLPYGFCVWAAGNGPIPFVLDTVNKIAEQQSLQGKARGRIVTDNWLRVMGAEVSSSGNPNSNLTLT